MHILSIRIIIIQWAKESHTPTNMEHNYNKGLKLFTCSNKNMRKLKKINTYANVVSIVGGSKLTLKRLKFITSYLLMYNEGNIGNIYVKI